LGSRTANELAMYAGFCIIFLQQARPNVYGAFHFSLAKKKVMQPARRSLCTLILVAALGALLSASTALAHAILLESSPTLKSAVTGPDVPIKLRFNVRIDAVRSRLTLIHPDGSAQTLEISKGTPADTLSAEASGLAAGTYRLRWQVLASDGHITRGEIPFTVTPS
jgi:copper resistance protein C